jgi:hypothetical protein
MSPRRDILDASFYVWRGGHSWRIRTQAPPARTAARALNVWLDRQGLSCDERDLTDAAATEARTRCGVRVAPVTVLGDQFFGTFADQRSQRQRLLADSGQNANPECPQERAEQERAERPGSRAPRKEKS